MTEPGIDYGLIGQSNRDKATGIHYGVISQHSVMPEALNDLEPDYGEATCPKCGNVVCEYDGDKHNEYSAPGTGHRWMSASCDYACESCEILIDSQDAYGDEPQGFTYDSDGYQLTDCLDSDIFVLASPFYTFANFCSPCVPGAGNLDSDNPDGVKTYCLGHDWFENGKAPYPVYSVATDAEVQP